MSASAPTHDAATVPRRRRILVPSIVSGLVLGVVAAVVAALVVHSLVSGSDPRRPDDTVTAAYAAWFIFFLIGVGAANYPIRWGLGKPDPTHEDELELAGKGQGVWRYFRFCTDHKVIGIQYLVTVLILFAVGGLASWMIRLEQSRSGAKVFTPATYNSLVGMHGLVMIVTTIIMLSAAFGNYFVPIMIGANDMAFPRVNALSYWLLFSVIPVLLSSVFLGGFPTGWTGYAPLADQAALGMDAYCMTIIVFGLSLAVGGMNMFVTVLKMRAPGLTWTRLPVFVWSTVLSTLLGLLVFPAFTAAALFTLLDRVFGTTFYQAAYGGSNFIYEQLFWFMGHPEVYVILLPGVGAICEVVTVFSRKPLFGYRMVVGAMIAIFVLSLTVWMHHLYWSGANTSLDTPIMLDTELISIPTGVIFLALLGTVWRGRVRLEPPMLFALAFGFNFLIGGVTGLYLADVPTDTLFHGDMFTVAHFHFTLVGGVVFAFLAGFYYWFPKMTGRQLDPTLSRLQFWLFEIGFLGIFLPLFYAGMRGEPRWQAFVDPRFHVENLIASLFVIPIIASVAVLGYNVLISWIRGVPAVANVWGGRTLEWTLPSPVPLINFEHPVVVAAGPYDYGMGGPKVMGVPAIAGASVDAASVPVPHLPDPVVRAGMAHYGAGLMILSWTMLASVMFVAYIYLDALDTLHQFRPGSEAKPTTVGNVLLALGALAAAAAWTWGYRRARSGDRAQARTGVVLGWILTLAGLAGTVVVFASLKAPLPLHAYASATSLFTLFHAWHLVGGLLIATIVLGRMFKGRIAGHEYVIQVVGWWLWYAAIVAVATTLLVVAVS
jgi:cytochrome c oxidase subunit I